MAEFFKGALKFTENFHDLFLMDFLFTKLQTCKLKPSALHVFKAPMIMSPVEFPSTETDSNRFSIEKLL